MNKRVHTEVSNVRRRVSQRRNGLVAMRSRHERELADAERELARAENRLAVLEGRAAPLISRLDREGEAIRKIRDEYRNLAAQITTPEDSE